MPRRIGDVAAANLYPIMREFLLRKANEFHHIDNRSEHTRLNMVQNWQEKYRIIPLMRHEHPGLKMAQPPNPAIIAYLSLLDKKFQRNVRREKIADDIIQKADLEHSQFRYEEHLAQKKSIATSIEKAQLTFDEIKRGLQEQIAYNTITRHKIQGEWSQNQKENAELRVAHQSDKQSAHEWSYWHLREYRDAVDAIYKNQKDQTATQINFENARYEKLQPSHSQNEKPIFYNPTEIAMIFAAHQMAQNYMMGYSSVNPIDSSLSIQEELNARTVLLTNVNRSE